MTAGNDAEMHVEPTDMNQFDVVYEISKLLNTGLSKETLQICVSMIEDGTNPLALADFVRQVTEHCSK